MANVNQAAYVLSVGQEGADRTAQLQSERDALVAAFHELMEHVPAFDEPGEPAWSIAVDYGVEHIIFPPHRVDDD